MFLSARYKDSNLNSITTWSVSRSKHERADEVISRKVASFFADFTVTYSVFISGGRIVQARRSVPVRGISVNIEMNIGSL